MFFARMYHFLSCPSSNIPLFMMALVFLFARAAYLLRSTLVWLGVSGRLWLICSVWAGDKTWLRHQAQCGRAPLFSTISSPLIILHFPRKGWAPPESLKNVPLSAQRFSFSDSGVVSQRLKVLFQTATLKWIQFCADETEPSETWEVNSGLCNPPDVLQFPDMKLISGGKSTAMFSLIPIRRENSRAHFFTLI